MIVQGFRVYLTEDYNAITNVLFLTGDYIAITDITVNWRINKLLLPHNLYSGAKHIPLFSQRPFHFIQQH